jgi:trans-2-enoyl-CoA reductase
MNLKQLIELSAFIMVKRTFLFFRGFFFPSVDFSLHVNLFIEMNIRKS